MTAHKHTPHRASPTPSGVLARQDPPTLHAIPGPGLRQGLNLRLAVLWLGLLSAHPFAAKQITAPVDRGLVQAQEKISNVAPFFPDTLDMFDMFGGAVTAIGDLDMDGVIDVAAGAIGDGEGSSGPADRGAAWILMMANDGTVKSYRRITDSEGGFGGILDVGDSFGSSLAGLGDLDGDTVPDLAVGARGDGDGGPTRGALWILFLNVDGTVKSHQKISDTQGGFGGSLSDGDGFGFAVTSIGDLDSDGVPELASSAPADDDGGPARGALWILFMNTDGTVKDQQKISQTQGGFAGALDDADFFGSSVTSIGDLDSDGIPDLAVGAFRDDDGGGFSFNDRGAVWVLFLNSDGTVKSHQKISDTMGSFSGILDDSDRFGSSVSALNDFDLDGLPDVAVGSPGDDDGGPSRGALWLLFLDSDGTVKSHQKISATSGGLTAQLDDLDFLGSSVALLGDLDLDGIPDVLTGATGDDDGGPVELTGRGALWTLFLNSTGTVKAHQKISDLQGGLEGTLDAQDYFGTSVASIGDVDFDGIGDIAVGSPGDDDPSSDERGAAYVLLLTPEGTVKSFTKISSAQGGFGGSLDELDAFGSSLAPLGDLDVDGTPDVVVGAPGNATFGDRGAVWVLFLNADGTVKAHQEISSTEGAFTGTLDDGDSFGSSVDLLGDLDQDGVADIAVGAVGDDDGSLDRGAVWMLFLNASGTVKSHQKVSDTAGGFTGILTSRDIFSASIAALGDLDNDGVNDMAVGAPGDEDGGGIGSRRGAVWVLFLNSDGTVKSHQKISSTQGGFTGQLEDGDQFGMAVSRLDDFDSDGVPDLAVGALRGLADASRGAVWVLFLNTDGTVKAQQEIHDLKGGFSGTLQDGDSFGSSLALLDDLDLNGLPDLAVGARLDDDGAVGSSGPVGDRGAVWVLFLKRPQLRYAAPVPR